MVNVGNFRWGTQARCIGGLVFAVLFVRWDNHVNADGGARTPLAPGSVAPAWENLVGVDDGKHSLADLKDAAIVVVAFTCNSCPFAKDYEDRFIAFAKKYAERGVRLVAMNVNTEEADRLPAMKARAKEKSFPFPYLYDPTQKIGMAYGARVTPHLFILDKERKIAYVGAFDNARRAANVKKRYVEDAVEALLAGKTPQESQTRAAGCTIHYEE